MFSAQPLVLVKDELKGFWCHLSHKFPFHSTFVKWNHYLFFIYFVRKSFNFIDIKSASWAIMDGCQN